MSSDYTEHQSTEELRRAQKLSLQRNTPPAEVPGYEMQRFLGSGAYGEVWVGVDQNTGRRVAIKFYLHRGGIDWSLLSREVEKLVFLSADRYVVQLLDVGWDADPPYYVMDYIENGSLEDLLRDEGPRPLPEALDLFREVAVGLMHLHGKGVLHCDLKPANVLLDQDNKPRLADFGQSRLSHEQSPALGTLFYMAPEQADLEAVPDARWDVYALGALLYCMLTGEPPYRTEDTVSEIDTAAGLEERLMRYRTAINASKPPVGHRKVPGIDKGLIEIVDRCLAAGPKDRFASVQSVLEALRARDEARARRPLLMLGLIGPMVLLVIMFVFGWVAYGRVMNTAIAAVAERTQQSNEFASKFAARGVAAEIDQYFEAVEKVSQNDTFVATLSEALEKTTAERRDLKYLDGDKIPAEVKTQLEEQARQAAERLGKPVDLMQQLSLQRKQFAQQPALVPLQKFVNGLLPANDKVAEREAPNAEVAKLLKDVSKLPAASWFVCDRYGTQVAAVFPDQSPSATVGRNFRWRTYFHGGPGDEVNHEVVDGKQIRVYGNADDHIIAHTHLSAVFESTATGTWKVAISTPIFRDGESAQTGAEPLGIVALTVEVGNFIRNEQFGGTQEQFAVLVDGREGRTQGVILQHPLYDKLLARSDVLPARFSKDAKYRVNLAQVDGGSKQQQAIYYDPLGRDPEGRQYAKPWIAAKSQVLLPGRKTATGLVVLVEESYEESVAPIYHLGDLLKFGGVGALVFLAVIALALRFYVGRQLRPTVATSTHSITGRSSLSATPLHKMETITARHAPKDTS